MEEMDGPLALQMRMIIWINAGINIFCVLLSMIAWFMLMSAYSKRQNDLAQSIKLARNAYVLDFGSFIVFYLCIPLAIFFNTRLLQRDMCVYTLYSIVKGGPVTRQAMATAATMKGLSKGTPNSYEFLGSPGKADARQADSLRDFVA
eukprot:3481776-Amphidinium_carterae.1